MRALQAGRRLNAASMPRARHLIRGSEPVMSGALRAALGRGLMGAAMAGKTYRDDGCCAEGLLRQAKQG